MHSLATVSQHMQCCESFFFIDTVSFNESVSWSSSYWSFNERPAFRLFTYWTYMRFNRKLRYMMQGSIDYSLDSFVVYSSFSIIWIHIFLFPYAYWINIMLFAKVYPKFSSHVYPYISNSRIRSRYSYDIFTKNSIFSENIGQTNTFKVTRQHGIGSTIRGNEIWKTLTWRTSELISSRVSNERRPRIHGIIGQVRYSANDE